MSETAETNTEFFATLQNPELRNALLLTLLQQLSKRPEIVENSGNHFEFNILSPESGTGKTNGGFLVDADEGELKISLCLTPTSTVTKDTIDLNLIGRVLDKCSPHLSVFETAFHQQWKLSDIITDRKLDRFFQQGASVFLEIKHINSRRNVTFLLNERSIIGLIMSALRSVEFNAPYESFPIPGSVSINVPLLSSDLFPLFTGDVVIVAPLVGGNNLPDFHGSFEYSKSDAPFSRFFTLDGKPLTNTPSDAEFSILLTNIDVPIALLGRTGQELANWLFNTIGNSKMANLTNNISGETLSGYNFRLGDSICFRVTETSSSSAPENGLQATNNNDVQPSDLQRGSL